MIIRLGVFGLILIMGCVVQPKPLFGFAFTTLDSSGVPISDQTSGVPIVWPNAQVEMNVGFGNFPIGFVPSNGSNSWNENATQALQRWTNIERSNFQFIGVNQVDDLCALGNGEFSSGWAENVCGQQFGDAIAVTRVVWRKTNNGVVIVDADVIFNSTVSWDAYDGPTRTGAGTSVIYDFQRTTLHEFGHVLGLGHPDVAGQSVEAVMNATSVQNSTPDRLTDDDKNGAIALYTDSDVRSDGGGSSSSDWILIALIVMVSILRNKCNSLTYKKRSSSDSTCHESSAP